MSSLGMGMFSAFVPQLLKMAESPKVKAKIIDLLTAKKQQYVETFGIDKDDNLDVQFMLSCSEVDIIVKVVVYDKGTHVVIQSLDFYKFEELVSMVKNLL